LKPPPHASEALEVCTSIDACSDVIFVPVASIDVIVIAPPLLFALSEKPEPRSSS
jgi:hypothetical protein